GPDHAIHGVATAPAHADYLDLRRLQLLAKAHADSCFSRYHALLDLLQFRYAPLGRARQGGQGYDAPANMAFNLDTRFPARCGAVRRAFAPYITNPTTVAYSGWATCSGRSARPFGSAMRMGRWKYCSARSSKPLSLAPPPASTNPAGICLLRPARCKSSRINASSSWDRGSMMSVR